MTISKDSDFYKFLKKNSDDLEHQRNLRGMTRARCDRCTNGCEVQGRTDYDGSGPFWSPGVVCRKCGGFPSSCETPCTPEVELAAVDKEIALYRARRKVLVKKVKSNGP